MKTPLTVSEIIFLSEISTDLRQLHDKNPQHKTQINLSQIARRQSAAGLRRPAQG
jgi:hypothetical protein